jgi:hypothetical protein
MSNRNEHAHRALANAVRNARLARIGSMPRELRGSPDAAELHAFYGRDRVILEPHIDQDEVFDDQFERRAHEIQPTPGSDNAISIIPSKRGPWSGNNQLGIERAFSPDENNRQTVIKLDEWGFPEHWTLCLGLTYDTHQYDPNGSFFSMTAEVEFGVGGVTQYLEMDWIQGAAISLPMNALNVVASFNPGLNEGGAPIELPEDLRLRASVVRGQIAGLSPTRTLVFSGTEDQFIAVPSFAKEVRLFPQTQDPFLFYSALDTIEFLSGPPDLFTVGTIATHTRSQFSQYLDIAAQVVGAPTYIAVPEAARFLRLNGTPGSPVYAQFRLGV